MHSVDIHVVDARRAASAKVAAIEARWAGIAAARDGVEVCPFTDSEVDLCESFDQGRQMYLRAGTSAPPASRGGSPWRARSGSTQAAHSAGPDDDEPGSLF
jgi:hypothetical protein